jgi:nicotinate-nucleotide pyrophosphorylase (carboxylating)
MLIKDNHLAGVGVGELAGFVAKSVQRARELAGPGLSFVQVEVDSLEQLAALCTLPPGTVDIVLLDNMTPAQLREAAAMRDAKASQLELEASGGVSLETIAQIAATGVDRISVGALTHSATQLDVGLDFA